MQPKFIVEAPQSKYIDEAKPPGSPLVPKTRKKKTDLDEVENSGLIPDLIDILEDGLEHQKVAPRTYIKFKKWIIWSVLILGSIALAGLLNTLEFF